MNRFKIDMRMIWCLLILTSFQPVQAVIINAASGSFTDVSSAVSKASYGDTVQIPAGTWTWTTPNLTISGITLAGAGTNATIISDGLSSAGGGVGIAYLLACVTVPNTLTRVTGITFQDAGAGSLSYHGKLEFNGMAGGPSSSWRLDHCAFVNLQGANVFVHGFAVSVIDHCSFILGSEGICQYGINTSINDYYGDNAYASPPTYGTDKALYIENCYFTNIISDYSACGAYDGFAGARVVFRNNVLARCAFATHGNDTSGRYRSIRSYEIYNNVFIHNQNWVVAMDFRGGTGVVFSNSVTGFQGFNTIENYRNVEVNNFGGVTGINSWDNNSPTVFLIATNSGLSGGNVQVGSIIPQGTVTVAGANWTPNQWAGYVFYDTSANAYNMQNSSYLGVGVNPMCLIQGNSTNQLYFAPPKDYIMLTTNGDVFSIYYTTAALDQVGRGSGDLLQDVTVGNWPNSTTWTINTASGTNSWPRQVLEPLYSWGNTLNGNPAGIVSGYANIIEGRDIYANTVKPNYTPFTYPHPLDVSNKKLSPPSGLSAH